MDALAAVGLAGNICGFIDFACKLVSSSRAIYNSSSGLSAGNFVLETIAQDVRNHCDKIRLSLGSSPEITALAAQSHHIAEELLAHISKLRARRKKSKWDSFLQALNDVMKKEEVSALVQRLSDLNKQVTSHMLLHLLTQQGRLAESLDRIESGIELAGGDLTISSFFRADLEKMAVATRDWQASTASTLSQCLEILKKLSEHNSRHNSAIPSKPPHVVVKFGDATAAGAFYSTILHASSAPRSESEFVSYIIKLQSDADSLNLYQRIIDALKFKELRHREYQIREAHSSTFKWVLDESRQDINFVRWLKGRKNIFWIRGKPGAGKSTLMKYICQQPETQIYLESWADGQPLVTAKYFFWSSGDRLQRSQEGLLRSLLYDLLKSNAALMRSMDLADKRAAQDALDCGSWNVQGLTSLIGKLVQNTPQIKYCFFIDGLDEFEGRPDDLIHTVSSLAGHDNAKLCLSSRHWMQFQDAYGHDSECILRVESLTEGDIRSLVTQRLNANKQFQLMATGAQTYRDLVEDVVRKASGVLLWVVLVVRSLLDGLTCRDSIDELRRRVEELPEDLNDFYGKILGSIEQRYQKRVAYTFRILRECRPLPLDMWAALDEMDGDSTWSMSLIAQPSPLDELMTLQLIGRLDGRYKGLLEPLKYGFGSQPKVTWLHRSVVDYLKGSEVGNTFGMSLKPNGHDFLLLCSSLLGVMKRFPGWFQFDICTSHINDDADAFLDVLNPLIKYRPRCGKRSLHSLTFAPRKLKEALYDIAATMEGYAAPKIWYVCVETILDYCDELFEDYIQYRLKTSTRITTCRLKILMQAVVGRHPAVGDDKNHCRYGYKHHFRFGCLRRLLDYGADPDWPLFRYEMEYTNAEPLSLLRYILHYSEFRDKGYVRRPEVLEVVRLLAASGADPDGNTIYFQGQTITARQGITHWFPELGDIEWKAKTASPSISLPIVLDLSITEGENGFGGGGINERATEPNSVFYYLRRECFMNFRGLGCPHCCTYRK